MKKITPIIDSAIFYIESYMSFIAGQISLQSTQDATIISEILLDSRESLDRNKRDLIDGKIFDFTLPNGLVLADNKNGILTEEKRVNPNERSWMILAPEEPWRAHISRPDLSITPTIPQMIIPIGYGVTNRNNEFLGSITTGVSIDKLKERIQRLLGNRYYNFVVINNEGDFVFDLSLEDLILEESDFNKLKEVAVEVNTIDRSNGVLSNKITLGNNEYLFYEKSEDNPFIVLMGVNQQALSVDDNIGEEVGRLVKKGAYENAFLMSLMHLFENKVSKPMLGKTVVDVEIPKLFDENINRILFQLEQAEVLTDLKIEKEVAEEVAAERQELIAQKEKFFHMVLHDLRTPMSCVDGAIMLAKEGIMEKDEALEMVRSSIDKIRDIANNLLVIARMERGKLEIIKSDVDIASLIEETVGSFRYTASNKGLKLYSKIDLPEDSSNFIKADEKIIIRILNNLISNSLKFTSAGEVIVGLKKSSEIDNTKTLYIKDTGCGIAEEDLVKVMEEYGQADVGKLQRDGLGLGMPTVKKFVEMHGGIFEIESEVDKGTTVSITLKE